MGASDPLRTDFDEEVAREVCAAGPLTADGVGEALRGLVAKSVVKQDGEHHRMLDTLREYGRMWLAELGEERAAADRHAAFFLGLARRAHAGWTGPEQVSWYHRIAAAHLDLCAALDHLLAHDIRAAQEMTGRVGFFWSCCGHLSEARVYAGKALAAGPAGGPDRTRLQWVHGVAALLQGDFATAERLGARCVAEARRDRDDEGLLSATYLSGLTHLMTGRPRAALDEVGRVLPYTGAVPAESAYRLRCRLITVFAMTALDRLAEAAEAAVRLRAVCRAQDEYWIRSYVDYQLALISLLQGRPGNPPRTPGRCSRASTGSGTASASPSVWTSSPPPSPPRARAPRRPGSTAPGRRTGGWSATRSAAHRSSARSGRPASGRHGRPSATPPTSARSTGGRRTTRRSDSPPPSRASC